MDKLKLSFHIIIVLNVISLYILLLVVFQIVPYIDCEWPAEKISQVNNYRA